MTDRKLGVVIDRHAPIEGGYQTTPQPRIYTVTKLNAKLDEEREAAIDAALER